MDALTKNFAAHEFCDDDAVSEFNRYKLWLLCTTLLQPLRDKFGPVKVTSGIRTEEHNRSIGGASNSHHLYVGYSAAADVVLVNHIGSDIEQLNARLDAFCFLMTECLSSIGELIWYENTNHFHIALPSDRHGQRISIKFASGGYTKLPTDATAAADIIKMVDERFSEGK